MLRGDLTDLGLLEVLASLITRRPDAVLSVTSGGGTGHLRFSGGQLVDAVPFEGRALLARRLLADGVVTSANLAEVLHGPGGPADGRVLADRLVAAGVVPETALERGLRAHLLDAATILLAGSEGTFAWEADAAPVGPPTPGGVEPAELTRTIGERLAGAAELRSRTGAPSDPVVPRPPAGSDLHLPAAAWTVIGLLDGRRSVGELIELLGRGELATRALLADLLDAGLITIGGGPDGSVADQLLHGDAVLRTIEPGGAPLPEVEPFRVPEPLRASAPAPGDVEVSPGGSAVAAPEVPRAELPDEATLRRLIAGVEALR